jgi:hypothetical protein
MRTWPLALLAAVVVGAAALPALAIDPVSTTAPQPIAHGIALSAGHPVLTFAGTMHNPAPIPMANDPDPTVCAVDCQLWSLQVATHQPFLASIHNGNSSIDDGFNLYVYDPAGNQVAASNGIGTNGQAAVVHPTSNGVYTIAITATYAYDVDAGYLGEARIMSGSSWDTPACAAPPCALLPALRTLPPTDVRVDGVPPVASTPLGFPLPGGTSTGASCYLDETASTGATRCLRFTSEVDNSGVGLLNLRIPWAAASSGESAFLPDGCRATQVVSYTDGTTRDHDAGACEYHAAHGHFHYRDFVEFALHKVNPDGTPGPTVAASLKESFCLADDGYFGFGTPGPNGPRTYVGQPDCNVPSAPGPTSPDAWISMGVAPGWGDIYTWDTPDQFIDISSTPDGVYDIVARANPNGDLLLGDTSQECAATRIRLTSTDVTVLSPSVPCP